MKLMAFITSTMAMTDTIRPVYDESSITPPGMGSAVSCTPCQASSAAAKIWPTSLVIQSRSQMSSATPMATMMSAAPRIANIGPGLAKISENCGNCEVTPKATTTPMNMAIPPRRGVGLLCTSRSRICG